MSHLTTSEPPVIVQLVEQLLQVWGAYDDARPEVQEAVRWARAAKWASSLSVVTAMRGWALERHSCFQCCEVIAQAIFELCIY